MPKNHRYEASQMCPSMATLTMVSTWCNNAAVTMHVESFFAIVLGKGAPVLGTQHRMLTSHLAQQDESSYQHFFPWRLYSKPLLQHCCISAPKSLCHEWCSCRWLLAEHVMLGVLAWLMELNKQKWPLSRLSTPCQCITTLKCKEHLGLPRRLVALSSI